MSDNLLSRFLRYVQIDTQSDETSKTFPSTPGQLVLLRDFELKGLADKGKILRGLCRGLQAGEPRARVRCKIHKQYRNMAYWLRKDMRPVELAREAFVAAGLKPYDHVIRGGTDGSRLTELGLPTPNLFCGEHNAHGPLEWVLAELWERKS